MSSFSGLWIPIVTPLRENRVDIRSVDHLVDRFARAGCAGLVVCTTTGESASLKDNERAEMLEGVLAASAGRLPVVMGVAGTDTTEMALQARRWQAYPLAGLLVTPPAYVRPSQQGCLAHFQAVAAATDQPIVIYNIGYRTGVSLSLDTLASLARDPQFAAIKECGGDLERLHDLIALQGPAVLCGEDSLALIAACLGAPGAIAASAHLRTDWWVAMLNAVREQRLTEARQLFARLLPVIRLLFAQPNPAPLKAALSMAGEIADEMRLPMLPLSGPERDRLADALAPLEIETTCPDAHLAPVM